MKRLVEQTALYERLHQCDIDLDELGEECRTPDRVGAELVSTGLGCGDCGTVRVKRFVLTACGIERARQLCKKVRSCEEVIARAECDAASPAFAYIISVLKSKKVAVVAGTGNDREIMGTGGIGMPACITGAIAVGASTDGDTTAYYSNTGFHDLMAPGGEPGIGIYSSIARYFPPFYVEKSGTSMATPHVAGAFALLRAAKPTATVSKLLDDLKVTGTPIPDAGLGGWPFPRINIPAALARP